MAFFDDLGGFFNQLGGSVTGANKNALTKQSLTIQEQIAQKTLDNDLAVAKLKYSPDLAKQRTKQISVIVLSFAIIGGLVIYFKYLR